VTRLLGVEVRRLLARRLARVVALLCIVGIAVAGVIVFIRSEPLAGEAKIRAENEAEQRFAECMDQLSPQIGEVSAEAECRDASAVGDPRFRLTDLQEVALGSSGLLILLGWVVGASAIGAEWQAGTMTTLLTWEPRRTRLLIAKAIACVVIVFAASILLQLLLGGSLLPSALLRGTTEGADASWLRSTLGIVLRTASIAALAALLGFCLASLARHTAAALGISFALAAVVEPLLTAWRPSWQRWLLNSNMTVFVTGEPAGLPSLGRSVWDAGLVLAGYGVATLLVALFVFNRRDVT
jgi:ABC-2 type transport system permease protein